MAETEYNIDDLIAADEEGMRLETELNDLQSEALEISGQLKESLDKARLNITWLLRLSSEIEEDRAAFEKLREEFYQSSQAIKALQARVDLSNSLKKQIRKLLKMI